VTTFPAVFVPPTSVLSILGFQVWIHLGQSGVLGCSEMLVAGYLIQSSTTMSISCCLERHRTRRRSVY